MNIPDHPTLIQRMIDARVKQLTARGPVLTGSLVQIAKHCGHPGCRCQRGVKHVGHYLTFDESGRTRTVYVPVDLRTEVQKWINERRRLRQLMQEISKLSVALIRGHVKHKRRQAGRS